MIFKHFDLQRSKLNTFDWQIFHIWALSDKHNQWVGLTSGWGPSIEGEQRKRQLQQQKCFFL
jgi:hypothetical protein